jgi:RNA polymerase sigma-70 factor (ECF subfamily)
MAPLLIAETAQVGLHGVHADARHGPPDLIVQHFGSAAMGRLAEAFVDALDEPGAALAEDVLGAMVAAARAAWPGIEVDPERFVRFVAQRVGPGVGPRDLPASDLYLACACADGDPRAIAAFERRYFRGVDAAMATMRAPAGVADEVKQVLRARFFVSTPERHATIADFGGRGDLNGWVRVSAVREALRILARQKRSVRLDEALLDELTAGGDPEIAAVKSRCRAELATALREALAALSPRARTLLRYQIVDGLGISAMGAIYGVHRATVARWLAQVRADVVADTQRRLATRLQLSQDEVESVIRLVQSQLDLSIVSLLGSPPP